MKPIRTWIVVADGAQVSTYLYEGSVKGLAHDPVFKAAHHVPASHDLVTDGPGKGQAGHGRRHGMVPRSDPHTMDKDRFTAELAERLDHSAGRNEFDRLVLVAPPKVLGALRQYLGKASQRVHGEIAKDLTHVAPKDLLSHIEPEIVI